MDDKINSKDTSVDTEALEKIEGEISELAKKLSAKKKERNRITAKTEIDFTITTIHADRRPMIILKAQKIDRNKSYADFLKEWETSIADENAVKFGARVGTITGRGSRERLVSVMHKIAKHGGTIVVDPEFAEQIPIPPANIWWDPDDVFKEAQKALDKEAKNKLPPQK